MKKIFTLLCCAVMAFTASAQIEILKADKKTVMNNGETIEFSVESVELFPGYSVLEAKPQAPYFVNKSNKEVEISVLVTKEDPNNKNLSWCMSGACSPITGPALTKTAKIAAGDTLGLDLHAENFIVGEYKTVSARVNVKTGVFSQDLNIKFVYADPTGIEAQNADKITVANKQLSYSFSNSADRVLNIYGVSGRLVKTAALAQNGNVALNDLHRGVYIYEVLTDGKRTAAHKFVVR